MVVGYGPSDVTDVTEQSFRGRLTGSAGSALVERLLRTPIHREVSVLVAAGALLLIGVALFLSQRAGSVESPTGDITSEVAEGDGTRSNGFFEGIFGGDDTEDADAEDDGPGVGDSGDGAAEDDGPGVGDSEDDPEDNDSGTDEVDVDDADGNDETASSTPSSGSTSSSPPDEDQTSSSAPSPTQTTAKATVAPTTPSTLPSTLPSTTERTTSSSSETVASSSPATSEKPPPPPVDAGTPYRNHSLPGVIQAEFFDKGGQGEGYNDLDAANDGGQLRNSNGVDLYRTDGGAIYVGKTRTNEWLQYTITIPEDGAYFAEASVSSTNSDPGALVMLIDGDRFARFNVEDTNGNWVRLTSDVEPIPAGVHVVRLNVIDGGRFRLDWFSIRSAR